MASLPERFHFFERRVGGGPALFLKSGFYPFETIHDFGIGHAKRGLGIDFQVPSQIGDDEEQVADLAFDLGMAGTSRTGLDDLTRFFCDLIENAFRRIPIETDACHPLLKFLRT